MPRASAAGAVVGTLVSAVLAAGDPTVVLRIQDPELRESSGLAVSALHRGVIWTHADGGNVAQVVALDRSGNSVATVTLAGVDPFDPEALAPGTDDAGRPALFLADIGDNQAARTDVTVFRFPEPTTLRDQSVDATPFRLVYPDGPQDAEALLVHPRTGRLLVATKGIFGGGLYRAPRTLDQVGTNRLTRVARVPGLVTDGAYLPDGRFALRTYATVYVYDRPGREVASADLPPQPQGESLAVDGDRLLVGSEGERSAVFAVPVPAGASDGSSGAVTPSPDVSGPGDPEPGDDAGDDSRTWLDASRVVRAAVIAVALVALVLALRRRPGRVRR